MYSFYVGSPTCRPNLTIVRKNLSFSDGAAYAHRRISIYLICIRCIGCSTTMSRINNEHFSIDKAVKMDRILQQLKFKHAKISFNQI